MTYRFCKRLIQNGRYDKEDMEMKLDVFLLADRITRDEYNELIDMMNKEH